MEKFQGFRPYIDMFNSGQLKPGQTIVVVYGEQSQQQYQVLPLDPQGRHPIYRISGTGGFADPPRNVKNFLQKREWYVKEISTEETN